MPASVRPHSGTLQSTHGGVTAFLLFISSKKSSIRRPVCYVHPFSRLSTMAVAPVFVVTGGAAGIGAAVAEEAVRRGYRVAIADHDGAALERKAAELKSISNEAKVLAFVMDVTSVEQNFAFRDEVLKTYGRADVVHLNAGIFTKDARMLGSWTKEGKSGR